jgi:arabinogalactan endo-1,4-beta-galactosidase
LGRTDEVKRNKLETKEHFLTFETQFHHMKKLLFFILIFLSINATSQCQLIGADMSYANSVLANGGIYKNSQGVAQNPYSLFAEKGANIVRARLFHTPANQLDYCGNPSTMNTLDDVTSTFVQAKNNGMQLELSVHYGDYFNDPSKQKMPNAWQGLSQAVLLDSIYNYTTKVLTHLHNQNVLPNIIAIGNETTWGFVDATATTNGWSWPADADKFNRALNAVDDFNTAHNTSIKKAIHFTDSTAIWLAGLFASKGIQNFDIYGLSFYPIWSSVTDISQFGTIISTLKNTYNKEVIVMETGVPWTTAAGDTYANIGNTYGNLAYPISPIGQQTYFHDLVDMVHDCGGMGVIYWAPDWIPSGHCDAWGQGSSYENQSFFNFNSSNTPLPVFSVFQYCSELGLSAPIKLELAVIYNPVTETVKVNGLNGPTPINLMDCNGRIVGSGNSQNDLDCNALSAGVYWIQFEHANRPYLLKFFKN